MEYRKNKGLDMSSSILTLMSGDGNTPNDFISRWPARHTIKYTRTRALLVSMPYICPPRKNRKRLVLSVNANHGRNTQSTLLSADHTFTSGLRRIRSSQVSLVSL